MSAKQSQKMCKSPGKAPKNSPQQLASDYEMISTNCTLIGSNNLNLCAKPPDAGQKKNSPRNNQHQHQQHQQPQQPHQHVANFANMPNIASVSVSSAAAAAYERTILATKNTFSAISNGATPYSPNYPNSAVSPYNVQISSPANSVAIKSPVASPQQIRPPTPQPILPQAFQQIPVMTSGANLVQIIHNNAGYQNHPVLARPTIPTLIGQNQQIKIKPPQNILPKPPSTSGPPLQQSKAPQAGARPIPTPPQLPQMSQNPAQIVLPTNQAILPAAQPGTLLLNQMPLIVQQNTPHGVQLILRPSTPNSSPQLTKNLAPQNLILQQGGIIQHAGGQRGPMQQPQQLVRVLTANGMIQQLAPTYITMNNQLNLQQLTPPTPINPTQTQGKIITQNGQHILQNHPGLCIQTPVNQNTGQGVVPTVVGTVPQSVGNVVGNVEQLPPPKRKPKKKKKIKEKLDLGSIMKLSGIGDEDDVMFESDNSETTNTDTNPPQSQQTQKQSIITSPPITTPLISSPLVTSPLPGGGSSGSGDQDPKQRIQINQNLSQNLSDINAINQNLTQIGLIQNSAQNFLSANQNLMPPTVINQPDQSQNLASFLSTLQNQNFSFNKFAQAAPPQQTFPQKQNGVPAPFNIQVQNFPNQNLILNQSSNTMLTPNFPGNLTLNNGILQTGNPMLPNFMQVQQPAEQFPHQRTGGFKLALSEDGRLILQHDPNLNQDIQSQLLLQNIFGINLQGGNLVLTSVSQPKVPPNPNPAPIETKKNPETKTVNILQNVISSSVSVQKPVQQQQPPPAAPRQEEGAPYVVNLTPEQLETLKKNGQVSVNGQIIYMQRPPGNPGPAVPPKPEEKPLKSPKSKLQKKPKPNHTLITQLQKPPVTNNKDDLKTTPQENKCETNGPEIEQFLSNLNINSTNLSQLISEKLSQELPNVDHKILNIQAGPNVGQLVAKIDISGGLPANIPANIPTNIPTSIPTNVLQNVPTNVSTNVAANIPQNTQIKQENEITQGTEKIYQRIQTIQLTPQKQQLLKNVQVQIQALTNRLQQSKNDTNSSSNQEEEIQNALRHLYHEQQKILATGKLLPNVNPVTCDNQVPTIPNIPKSNGGSFVTSLQPVVSSNQNQKIYYHNGNQIISLNPPIVTTPTLTPTSVAASIPPPIPQTTTITSTTVQTQTQTQTQTISVQQQQLQQHQQKTINNNKKVTVVTTPLPVNQQQAATATVTTTSDKGCQMSPNVTIKTEPAPVSPKKPTYSKAQLIEQQLQTDQNGANNPDINSPFASKADACKRLVRYHCYNQPVLSEKDLNKADEIFELTARHFIGKFQGMVNKYKYLLLKESMREVPTSELMMIDRMFLAEEQQSFLKLQSDLKLQNDLEAADEAPPPVEPPQPPQQQQHQHQQPPEEDPIKTEFQLPEDLIPDFVSVKQETETETTNTDFNIKCGLNYFAQDESCDSVVYATTSPTKYDDDDDDDDDDNDHEPPKKDPKSDESYNTTKIIGNFEIEINNKGCNSQESYTKNFRQKIIENRETETEEVFEKGDDYDEWLCIQRELGYLPPDSETKDAESKDEKSQKRTNENRLETLKKFRVEKHNKSKKSGGSIIGEVKFEVRIEHKKTTGKKRGHYAELSNEVSKKQKTSEIQIKQEDNSYLEENFPELLDAGASPPDGLIDTSIDEQVQSAIDSILNLQQIASMSLPPEKDAHANATTNANSSELMFNVSEGGEGLDDAVKSILS